MYDRVSEVTLFDVSRSYVTTYYNQWSRDPYNWGQKYVGYYAKDRFTLNKLVQDKFIWNGSNCASGVGSDIIYLDNSRGVWGPRYLMDDLPF